MSITEQLASIAVIVFVILIMIFICRGCYLNGVKDGRLSVALGDTKMHLVEFEDGSRNWYADSELKDLVEHTIIRTVNNEI